MRLAQFRSGLFISVIGVSFLVGCTTDENGQKVSIFRSQPGTNWLDKSPSATEQGLALHAEGRYAEAAGCFRNAIRSDSRNYKAYYYLGVAYDAQPTMGQEAIKNYKACLDVMTRTYAGQEDAEFRVRCMDALAISIVKSTNKAAEIDNLEKQVTTAPKPAEIYFILAKTFRHGGDADSAVENYSRAALQDNRNFLLLKEYGLYLDQLQQAQKSSIVLRQAYAIDPKDQDVQNVLRRQGIVPGPSLKEQADLARPVLPVGPLPKVNLSGFKAKPEAQPVAPAPAPFPADATQAPRD